MPVWVIRNWQCVQCVFYFFKNAVGSRKGTVFVASLSVFFCAMSKNNAARITNLTYKCSTMSSENSFILGSKGQILRCVGLYTLRVLAILIYILRCACALHIPRAVKADSVSVSYSPAHVAEWSTHLGAMCATHLSSRVLSLFTKELYQTRNTFCGTWYLPHSRVHKSMTELCA